MQREKKMERYNPNKFYKEAEEPTKIEDNSNNLEQKVKIETILKEDTEKDIFKNFSIYSGSDI